jgi:hypothetical protein
MHIAYQAGVELLGGVRRWITRRERAVWSLHDTINTEILTITKRRFKALLCINHSIYQAETR